MTSTFRLRSDAARCVGKKDYQQAIEHWREVIERDPQDLFSQAMVAHCFEWMGEFSQALDAATIVLDRKPTDPVCLQIAARAAVALEQHDQAVVYVEQSLMHPMNYSLMGNRLLNVLSVILRIGSFIPLLKRIHHNLGRQRAQFGRLDADWDDWARKYLAWYRSIVDGKK